MTCVHNQNTWAVSRVAESVNVVTSGLNGYTLEETGGWETVPPFPEYLLKRKLILLNEEGDLRSLCLSSQGPHDETEIKEC